MKKRKFALKAAGGLLIAFTISLAGCGNNNPAVGNATVQPAQSTEASAQPVVSQETGKPATSSPDKLAQAANHVQPAGAESTASPSPTQKPKVTFDSYSVDKPMLMGLAIGEAQTAAVKLHGNAGSTYVMDDPDDPITVHEYDDFTVGYNSKKLVQFVEVSSSNADPGLNGLKIGQTTADVSKALGKPDSTTDYVITYKTKTTILKLDVDTKTKTVQSIKLFGREE